MKRPVCAEPQRGFRFSTRLAASGPFFGVCYPAGLGPFRAIRGMVLAQCLIAAERRRSGGVQAGRGRRAWTLALVDLMCKKKPVLAADIIRVCAVLFVALYLVPTGAHLAELPNKIGLPSEQYMLVQGIYAGWDRFGLVALGALIFTAAHSILVRGQQGAFFCSLTAFLWQRRSSSGCSPCR